MEVSPDIKSLVGTRRRLAVNTKNFPATRAAKPSPNVIPCILLNLVDTVQMVGGM